jgi:hypothetical protein
LSFEAPSEYYSSVGLRQRGDIMSGIECKRCLLTSEVPGVRIEESGMCSVCTGCERDWGAWDKDKVGKSRELDGILQRVQKKGRLYDVLVPLSGGKDSVYVLYYAKKMLKLKCLAVTFDNGFLSDHARKNIEKACTQLGVDHILLLYEPKSPH